VPIIFILMCESPRQCANKWLVSSLAV
jgi:hypothetical protein